MPFLAPAFAAVSAFAGTWLGQLVIGIGGSLLSGMLQKMLDGNKTKPKQRQPGFQLSASVGDTSPLFFNVGYAATAGNKKYFGTWGNSGDVPNAYLTEVYQLSSIPGFGSLAGFWANKEKVTVNWGATPTPQGYPVPKFRVGGVDHMWLKFYDGTQTVADSFLTSKFASRPNYPWNSQMIGRGIPYVIVTTLINRELFNSQPEFLFEPAPRRFYDWRKDSTNGGSGAHRWNDQTTWEPTVNPVVVMYNIVRGVYYNGEWIYGGRNIAAFRLPPSSWTPAANECDRPITLAAGGTEPQFRCGYQIDVDVEALDALELLGRSCNARFAEIGGIFEILVGAPGAAVYSFTDDDIVVTRDQGYREFPSLNETHNAIEARYPEPGNYWALKDAPARYNADWEAEDGGRRLATGLVFETVPYGVQVQRLMETLIRDGRRWRTHTLAFMPDAWFLTGTSVVNWTSARNGYVNKKFLVMVIDGEPGMLQPAVLLEIDPSDYDWSSDMELPNPIDELTIVRADPQTPTGFQVFPAIFYDADGTARRPSILIQYDGNMPDIHSVHVLVRLKSSGAYVFDQLIPFTPPYAQILNGVFLPATTYEVAISYVAYSGRPMFFTEYLEVTTDDVRLTDSDINIDLSNVAKDVLAQLGTKPRQIIETFKRLGTLLEESDRENFVIRQTLVREISVQLGGLEASFNEIIEVALGPGGAIAQALESLYAAMGGNDAQVNVRWSAVAAPSGMAARYAIQAAVNDGSFRSATLFLDVPADNTQPSRIGLMAGQTAFLSAEGVPIAFIDDNGIMSAGNGSWTLDMNTGDMNMRRGSIVSDDGKFQISPSLKRIRISS